MMFGCGKVYAFKPGTYNYMDNRVLNLRCLLYYVLYMNFFATAVTSPNGIGLHSYFSTRDLNNRKVKFKIDLNEINYIFLL